MTDKKPVDVKLQKVLTEDENIADKRRIYPEAAIDFPQTSRDATNQVTSHTTDFIIRETIYELKKLLLFKTKRKWRARLLGIENNRRI